MSAHLRLLMNAIFAHENFRCQIIWKRTNAKGLAFTRFASNHDVILWYTRDDKWKWNTQYTAHDPSYVEKFYRYVDQDGRRYQLGDLVNPNPDRPNLTYEFLGVRRVWRWTRERMEEAYRQGIVVQSKPGVVPRMKRYLDEQEGNPIGSCWFDIPPLQSQSDERLGYPTQKPLALLERILRSCSDEGDVVLDPFCGCGTTVAAAQKLNRKWIGIDITHLAVNLIRTRLIDTFGDKIKDTFKVYGEPTTLEDAEALAEHDKYQFQFWALGLVGARPEASDEKKGADKGIDGKRFFSDELKGSTKTIIISVKGGKTIPANSVRDLRGTIEREGAEIGVLISIAEPTKSMREDAAAAGFYASPMGSKHSRIQLLTVRQLLEGKTIDMPSGNQTRGDVQTIKKARKTTGHDDQSLSLQL